MQLTLFNIEENKYLVTYWAKPYDDEGNINKNSSLKKYEELIDDKKLEIFKIAFKSGDYKYIEIKKIN